MKFREKIARFLYGRYGADSLYNALFVAELILLFIGTIFNILGRVEPVLFAVSIILYATAIVMLVFAMFRFFSRNVAKRRQENEAWLRFKAKFRRKKKPQLPPTPPTTFSAPALTADPPCACPGRRVSTRYDALGAEKNSGSR